MTGLWHPPGPVRAWTLAGLVVPVTQRSTWTGLLYLLAGAPLGVLWLVLVGAGLLIGGATAALGVGLPILLGSLFLTRRLAEFDRRLVNAAAAAGIAAPQGAEPGHHGGLRATARALLAAPRTWRSLGWVLFRAVAAVLVLAGAVLAAVVLAALLAVPFFDGYLQWGESWRSTSGWSSAWALPVGLLGLLGSLHVSRLLVAVHVRAAQVLLSPDTSARVAELTGQARRAQERARLARDLHDSIGHAMTLVVVQAGAAGTALDRDPSFVRQALADIATAARTALHELDTALGALLDDSAAHPPPGTLQDVPELLARTAAAGLSVELHLPGELQHVPIEISRAAYRVVQEACTNVLRHGGVLQTATVSIATSAEHLLISVQNPLRATAALFPPGHALTGRGLTGADLRVQELGGTMRSGPVGSQWILEATLPLEIPARSRP